eukprot:TRINITY_DN12797_c0_g2_i1.p1 TRINITY_DN12797_c0_g2~~TRINITY_DN12797_c0_g2_i1.p1  ORF type:complete len:314 (-),score=57.70 TRINITY_DN12797_c0_g2_i1:93-1034(-)
MCIRDSNNIYVAYEVQNINSMGKKGLIEVRRETDENRAINKQDLDYDIPLMNEKTCPESKVNTARSDNAIISEREVHPTETTNATESKRRSPVVNQQSSENKSIKGNNILTKNAKINDKPTEANSIINSNKNITDEISGKKGSKEEPAQKMEAVLLSFDIHSKGAKGQTISLADAFKKQKRSFIERKERKHNVKSIESRIRTKEEILEHRKEIMKSRMRKRSVGEKPEVIEVKTSGKGPAKEPRAELIERLASGRKLSIGKDAMKKRTERNYRQLPEVVRKREEDRKRQENLERIHIARLNGKVIFSFSHRNE